jgi:Tol biopolymer transport system component/TolA-binding protein
MKSRKTLTIIMAIGLIWGNYHSFAQTAEEFLPKAIQLEEVKGDLDNAIKTYHLILNKYPDKREVCAEALLHLGICYEKLGLGQARQTYRDVISKYSEQTDKVAIARERILRLDAYTAELIAQAEEHFKKGNELFKRWEYESAVKEYENAIKLRPNTQLALNAKYCVGQSWFRAGKYDAALATFTKLIEENPKSNIAPVTELMVAQVQNAMGNDKSQEKINNSPNEDTIIDPKTGITYTKIKSFVGKNDLISYTSGGFTLSPDGRFMVMDNTVVPVDGSDAFNLTEMEATRIAYAPEMKKAAFYADNAIWTVPVSLETGRSNGSPVKLLDGVYKYNYNVSWSPDGEKLVFHRIDKEIDKEFSRCIWTISVSDGSLTQVTYDPGYYRSPIWSPDGKTIAYWYNKDLWLVPAKGGDSRKIIDLGGVPEFWNPDGNWLYHSYSEKRQLFSMSNNQNFDLNIPREVGDFISFSHDGKKMLFYRPSYNEKWGCKVVSFSGGPSFEPIKDFNVWGGRWSPDSKIILSQVENEDGDFFYRILPFGTGQSYMMKIDVAVNGKPFPFDISPDHKKLAFTVAREDGSEDLYVVPISVKDARTTGPADLVFEGWSAGAYNVLFSWSPDGNNLALIHKNDIWIVPLSGGKPIQITNTPEEEIWISWSPNGEMISYFVDSTMTRSLHVIPASGGNSIKVLDNCKSATWSLDSKEFAAYSGGNISIIGLDGQIIRHIIKQNENDLLLDDFYAPKWSPDGKYLAFIGNNTKIEKEKSRLFMISVKGGKVTELAPEDNAEYINGVCWSPDGKWLLYFTEETVKVRPEGTMWKADFNEVLKKLAK